MRLALRYRWTFSASLVCAIIVAVLWGGNIGAVYPMVEVAFNKKGGSFHTWVDARIREAESDCAQLRREVAGLEAEPKPGKAPRESATRDRNRSSLELTSRTWQLGKYRWLREHVIRPYMPHDSFATLALIVGLLLVGTLIKSLFFVFHQILCARLAQLAVLDLRKTFFRRTLRLDLATFGRQGTSELMNRFTSDMDSLGSGINEFFGKLVREPLKMIVCLAGAAFVCWRLLLFSLVIAPVAAFLIRWLARILKRANRRAMEEMTQIYSILDETFQGIKVVKAFTMERNERHRFHVVSKNYFRKAMRIARYDSLTRPMTEVLGVVTICVALLAGAYLVLNETTDLFGIPMCSQPLSWAMLLLFYGMLAGVSDPARKLSEVFSRIQRAAAAGDRIYQHIDREPEIVDPPRPRRLARHHRELAFEKVHFHYHASQKVLDGIDLKVDAGETIAIVGPNGCGKSTLANLIPRFFDPVQGCVRLDGVDLRETRLRDLRGQIGLVTQETLLFDDTVLNNIRYGSPNATREDVIRAAQQAFAHRFIEERLERGYETIVGPRGNLLSGGQRQRIAIARAILRDPAILILDEATSQVDLESEQLIQKVLEQFIRKRTTVIITHRMATLALADRIVVMQAGRLLDAGTHDQLLNRCELYSRLHAIQFREIA